MTFLGGPTSKAKTTTSFIGIQLSSVLKFRVADNLSSCHGPLHAAVSAAYSEEVLERSANHWVPIRSLAGS